MNAQTFGQLLRGWRQERKLSQMNLAGDAGMSQRHLSFLETGRERPSRQSILRLTECLDVPLRDRNLWLGAAGFAPAYGEQSLDANGMAQFRKTIDTLLTHHEPYPALLLDDRWNLVQANAAALRFFALFIDPVAVWAEIGAPERFQIIRLCLHDRGLAPFVENWDEVIYAFLTRARRALARTPSDDHLANLVAEIEQHPAAPAYFKSSRQLTYEPVLPMRLAKGEIRAALFTMITSFGTAQDITLQALHVETSFPADEETEGLLRKLAG
jgi:transcriptional regulator with XRE-family HTH domain